ncbi:hypothetical protein D9601_02505 [Sphingomonas sp. MA1305]|uniref:hypothetical protein n=1 Tax=Sphingomonas sp. MA1305 TaxID=2479204 RepID=UPI0018DF7E97|nr:hypothetical protein [Sphingomonas sp. MA1305]MBI0474236.1 hypothetical protein [Sphingomonas sp. MA1305]
MTQDTKVDWGAAIEAVHEDGRVVPVVATRHERDSHRIEGDIGYDYTWATHSGQTASPWRIRNVPTPTNEVRERMEAAIRRHVAGKIMMYDDAVGPNLSVEAEFRAIVALLDPVDGDLLIAREMAADDLLASVHTAMISTLVTTDDGEPLEGEAAAQAIVAGRCDQTVPVRGRLAAIKRGRALERGDAA